MTTTCQLCGAPVDAEYICTGLPVLCLDCLYPGSDVPPGTVLDEYEGEAVDVIPEDEQ